MLIRSIRTEKVHNNRKGPEEQKSKVLIRSIRTEKQSKSTFLQRRISTTQVEKGYKSEK